MEKDIKRIKEELEEFMRKYNVTVKVETVFEGRSITGEIINAKANMTIYS